MMDFCKKKTKKFVFLFSTGIGYCHLRRYVENKYFNGCNSKMHQTMGLGFDFNFHLCLCYLTPENEIKKTTTKNYINPHRCQRYLKTFFRSRFSHSNQINFSIPLFCLERKITFITKLHHDSTVYCRTFNLICFIIFFCVERNEFLHEDRT